MACPVKFNDPVSAFDFISRALGRIGTNRAGFEDIDFAISKMTAVKERVSLQFRAEAFNVFKSPELYAAGNTFTAANFGHILATRTPRGDLAVRVSCSWE